MLNKLFILCITVLISSANSQDSLKVSGTDSLAFYTYATVPEFWEQMDDIFNDPTSVMLTGVL